MRLKFLPGLTILAVLLSRTETRAQIAPVRSFRTEMGQLVNGSATPVSNTVTDVAVSGSAIWLGTGKGLSRSTDAGLTWRNYYGSNEFGDEDVSAIALHNNEVWVATAHDTTIQGVDYPKGSGLRYSTDRGETWSVIPQPKDPYNVDTLYYNARSRIRTLGITTDVNNITYDIAATDSAVWIASYAGMARKSTDHGQTWQVVILPPDNLNSISPTDSLVFDVSPVAGTLGLGGNLNHRVFSVYAESWSTVWIGTAGGINRTTDGGVSWEKFNHQNELSPISGNFVVALRMQNYRGHSIMWAGTRNAEDSSEHEGVSFSSDSGSTWKTSLTGEFCHNVGFKDSIVYVVTDDGIYRSSDLGKSWTLSGTIYDANSNQRITSTQFYGVDRQGENIWFGGADGTVYTQDNTANPFGSSWTILRASQPLASTKSTYAYPNPFSPQNEAVRVHYPLPNGGAKVTVRVFDFGMALVRTVVSNLFRSGANEFDEIWDGRDDRGRQVSNGVYFYQVVVGNNDPLWGKILVLQ
ncbi:MAG TPA: FlgD immunoglobulin-like domain containing protein [Bacteroidota bacterium]|nr:FlgD immunoglobulin-like domain containing protein [Bacteroidota bacterium]